MKTKRYLSLLAVFFLILGCLNIPISAEQIPTVKRVLLNVAQNKPISSNQPESDEFPVKNLVDGNTKTFTVPSGGDSTKTEFVIDLQRKYNIEKLEIYSRFDGAADMLGRQYFQFIGANNSDFSDGVVLGYMNEQNDEVFPSSGCFTSVPDKKEAYRYIKFKRTGGGYYGYSELCVYAYQTVTEVSRGKKVVTNSGSAVSGDKAVNGTNNNSMDGWVNDKGTEYNYLAVDLEKTMPIGMIEMEGRNITTENPATRQNIAVYGSNNIDNITELTSKANLTEADGYKKFFGIGVFTNYNTFPYGKYPELYRTACSESESFRFITFRNTTLHCSAYGEVRAYVVNPEVLSVVCDEEYIYISFSDEMENAEVSLSDKEGNTLAVSGCFKDNYTYMLDISDLNKTDSYTLTVLKETANKKSVSLAEDYTKALKSLNALSSDEIVFYDDNGQQSDDIYHVTRLTAKTTFYNNGKAEKNASLYIALYDYDGRLKYINSESKKVGPQEKSDFSAELIFDAPIGADVYAKAFIWDMTESLLMPVGNSKKVFSDMSNIYVSTDGSDENRGTKDAPFKTIKRAQSAVAERNDDMLKDINVHISGGTYELSETLVFDENDSGKNGFYVNYKAEDGEKVVVSGGTKVSGWTLFDQDKNIYKAEISGIDDIRNLYVNGRSARAARSEGRIKPIDFYYENDEIKGYYVSSDDVGIYENAEDIRLFYTKVWRYKLCNVLEIIPSETEGQNIIKMQDKAFKVATDIDTNDLPVTTDNAFYIENAKELLDVAGEFYFDKDESVLYYMVESNENMETAEVYVPTLDRLIHIEGSDLADKVKNISFSGIHFAHSSRNDIYDGYIGGQAQSRTPLTKSNSSYPLDNTITGANIRVYRAENIKFENNTFSGLTAVGIGIYEGSNNVVIRGNKFYDIGDSAVTVGLPSDSYMEDAYYDEAGNYLGRNVALYKPAKLKNSIGDAPSANDGNNKTVSVINDTINYWQVDLGKEYEISQIRIPARKNYGSNPDVYDGTTLFRRNFKISGSKYEDFSDGGVELARQGSTAFDVATGFIGNTDTKEKFRYIRVEKTVKEHFPFAEVIVISPDQKCPILEVSKRTVIDNNYIARVGEINLGAPGIQLYYTEDAIISHNVIKDVPYSGVCVGWGWLNTVDSTTAKNNKVLNNRIENYAMRTYDAGGVYLLGTQTGNLVEGNYIKNQPNAYWALYADSGSENFVAKNNVFEDIDMAFAIGFAHSPSGKKNMTIKDNYTTTACWSINFTDENTVVEEPTVYLKSDIPTGAQKIINESGLEEAYKGIEADVPDGRWTLTTEDIYGDIIDHQKSYEGGSVGESMPDTTLISYYLSNPIKTASKVLALGKASASDEAVSVFEAAIKTATAEETKFKDLGYGYHNTPKGPIDRAHLIDVRVELIEAIDTFVGSMK